MLDSILEAVARYSDIMLARAHRRKLVEGLEPPPETLDDRVLRRATGIPMFQEDKR